MQICVHWALLEKVNTTGMSASSAGAGVLCPRKIKILKISKRLIRSYVLIIPVVDNFLCLSVCGFDVLHLVQILAPVLLAEDISMSACSEDKRELKFINIPRREA